MGCTNKCLFLLFLRTVSLTPHASPLQINYLRIRLPPSHQKQKTPCTWSQSLLPVSVTISILTITMPLLSRPYRTTRAVCLGKFFFGLHVCCFVGLEHVKGWRVVFLRHRYMAEWTTPVTAVLEAYVLISFLVFLVMFLMCIHRRGCFVSYALVSLLFQLFQLFIRLSEKNHFISTDAWLQIAHLPSSTQKKNHEISTTTKTSRVDWTANRQHARRLRWRGRPLRSQQHPI